MIDTQRLSRTGEASCPRDGEHEAVVVPVFHRSTHYRRPAKGDDSHLFRHPLAHVQAPLSQ